MGRFRKIENIQEWQVLLDRALFKTFFHSLQWESFLEKDLKWLCFERYLWQDRALLSLARVKAFGQEKFISHPFCEYGGPLPLTGEIGFKEFKKDLLAELKAPLKISFHPKSLDYFTGLSPVEARQGAQAGKRISHFLDFEGLKNKDLLSSFRYDIRTSIKKSLSKGLSFEELKDKGDLKKLYQLYARTMKRHSNIPLPFSFFKFFKESSSAKIFLVKKDKEMLTGSVFLFHDEFLHYFITGDSYQALREFKANHFLLYKVMEKFRHKVGFFDLGATRKGSSLENFKKGWRGKEQPILEINTSSAKERSQSKLRGVLKIMPTPCLRFFSKQLIKFKL